MKIRLLSFVIVTVVLLLAIPVGAEGGDFTLPIIPIPTPILKRGDLVSDDKVDANDAIYCLRHLLFPSKYGTNQNVDFDGNSVEDVNDAVYLLRHVLFPSKYELKGTV